MKRFIEVQCRPITSPHEEHKKTIINIDSIACITDEGNACRIRMRGDLPDFITAVKMGDISIKLMQADISVAVNNKNA